jgi:hypothetical protein
MRFITHLRAAHHLSVLILIASIPGQWAHTNLPIAKILFVRVIIVITPENLKNTHSCHIVQAHLVRIVVFPVPHIRIITPERQQLVQLLKPAQMKMASVSLYFKMHSTIPLQQAIGQAAQLPHAPKPV